MVAKRAAPGLKPVPRPAREPRPCLRRGAGSPYGAGLTALTLADRTIFADSRSHS
jgi:hypothetical protein